MTHQFGPHLLYVDVTNACPIGCAFCMYLPVQGHQHLELDLASLAGLQRLVDAAPIVHISGQGEPLTQPDRVLAVAGLAGPGHEVELITSGGIPWPRLLAFLERFETLAHERGFTPRIRLSADRWHAAAVRHQNHAALVRRSLDDPRATCRVAFRSVTTERSWLPEFFAGALDELAHHLRDEGPLRATLVAGGREFGVAMKRLVHPDQVGVNDTTTIEQYVGELADTKRRPFTFGNLDCDAATPGPDVTVRPDGVVHLYGLDGVRAWHLRDADLTPQAIESAIASDPILRLFYKVPFKQILGRMRELPAMSAIIDRAANPYWIVPALRTEFGPRLESALLGLTAQCGP